MENLFLRISDEPLNPEGPTVPQQPDRVSSVARQSKGFKN